MPNHPRPAGESPGDQRRRLALRPTALAALLTLLQACSALGPEDKSTEKEPPQLDITLSADADVNSDIKGRGAPVMLRIYELKSTAVFEDAEFFALQDHDQATLGADLLSVDQFILRPGESRAIHRVARPGTTAIGIFTAYRDLLQADWRQTYLLEPAPDAHWYRAVLPRARARLDVQLQARTTRLTADRGAPSPKPKLHAQESAKGLAMPVPPTEPPALPGPGLSP